MTIAAVKERLYYLIDHADSKKAKAMLTLLENDSEPDYKFSDAEMKELDDRWDDYLSGKTKSHTLEESMAHIKKQRENRKKDGV